MRARALDEHLLDAADARAFRSRARRCTTSTSRSIRSRFDLVGHLVGHRGRLGAGARRVDEREGAVEADLLDDLERLAKSASVSPGKPTMMSVVEREVGDRVRAAAPTSAR